MQSPTTLRVEVDPNWRRSSSTHDQEPAELQDVDHLENKALPGNSSFLRVEEVTTPEDMGRRSPKLNRAVRFSLADEREKDKEKGKDSRRSSLDPSIISTSSTSSSHSPTSHSSLSSSHPHSPSSSSPHGTEKDKKLIRSHSMRHLLQLFFNPMASSKQEELPRDPANQLREPAREHKARTSADADADTPPLDAEDDLNRLENGSDEDFSDGDDRQESPETLESQSVPDASPLSASPLSGPRLKSQTLSDLSGLTKGEKERVHTLRKPHHAHEMDKSLFFGNRKSFLDDHGGQGNDSTFILDPGSDLEVLVHENGKIEILSGSDKCLVQFLAPLEKVDADYIFDFLTTYRYFMKAEKLLEMLISRFNEFRFHPVEELANLVSMRVLNVLRRWFQRHPNDFLKNVPLLDSLEQFLRSIDDSPEYQKYTNSIIQIIQERKTAAPRQKIWEMDSTMELLHSVRKKVQSIPMIRIDPKSLAKQLTIREMQLFQSIQFEEFLFQGWTNSKTSGQNAPNLLAYISWFNQVSHWVATEVCMAGSLRTRVSILKYFITLARYCASWNNFNTVFEIVSGLNLPSVHRLKKTWYHLPSKYLKYWEELSEKLNPKDNYKSYRTALKEVRLPCLPYIGIYLSDLVYSETGATTLPNGKINFFKMSTISKSLNAVIGFQAKEYTYPIEKKLQQWLTFSMIVMDDDLLVKSSLRCEAE